MMGACDPSNILLMRDGLLAAGSHKASGPLLAMGIHGGLHQPLPFTGVVGEENEGISCKRWAMWGEEEEEVQEMEEGRGSKKIKRLRAEQVRALEASFEEEKKLEPERKQELAQKLGLQPRQVAVWFQNRRARSKTKQLELDFALLNSHYHSLLTETHRLKSEVARLTRELDHATRRTMVRDGVSPYKLSTIKGTLNFEEDMFKEATFKNDVNSVGMQDYKMSVMNFTKHSSPTHSDYSVIVDAESSTSMPHKDSNAYECTSIEDLKYSCLSHGWNDEGVLATSTHITMQPQDLVIDESPLNNNMIHVAMDWLWELAT